MQETYEKYDISYKEILSNLNSLFYEFKDSSIPVNAGTELSYTKTVSPLFYSKVIDASENVELLSLITSSVPYFYKEPREMISSITSKSIIENILQDTRDPGINDVPSIMQDSEFWNTWFRDTWGGIQNNMLLDIYNKLQYPFINENHFLNMSLFPKLANEIYEEESDDSESWIQFMDNEEENDRVYEKSYPFLGEEVGCLDYIEDVVNQKVLSNYYIIDYSSSQNELLDKWSESLYLSGQLGREDLDMEKTVFKLQDCKNELLRRKFSGSFTLFQMILQSLGRKGSYITTCTVSDINTRISINASTKALTSFNDKRKCRLLNIPGLISKPYDFTGNGDLIDTFYTKLDSIPLNTLLPIFYTSAKVNNKDFSIEEFFKDSSSATALYRNKYLRDNITVIDWTNLKGLNFTENIANSYDTLDMAVFNNMGIKENVTLDSTVVDDDNKEVTRYLDRYEPLASPKHVSSGVSDLNTDRILYHSNSLQGLLKKDYPYVTYPFADNNSLSLMDTYWLDYIEREMKKKSKAQDFFKVGAQVNTLLNIEKSETDRTATYSFFGISYTSKDSYEVPFDEMEYEGYSESTKYALLWYCTVTYTIEELLFQSLNKEYTITDFNKTLISKIKLRPSEKFRNIIPSKYRDDDGSFEQDYVDYIQYNLGVIPNTYSFAKNIQVWNNDIGFTTALKNFDKDVRYFEFINDTYTEVSESIPSVDKLYFTKNNDTFEVAMNFSDDTETLGYSKARFVFSNRDVLLSSALEGMSLTTQVDSSINSWGLKDNDSLFTSNLCSVYPSKDTKAVFYTMEKRNSLGETETYWSDPIKVLNLKDFEDVLDEQFKPDWVDLGYHMNPYLNYVNNSASTLRRYKGYSVADLLKETPPEERNFVPSSETALCNLNRSRGRIILCNDTGDDTLKETGIYGYFLDRVPLFDSGRVSPHSISESTSIKGDNRSSLMVASIDIPYSRESIYELIKQDIYNNPDSSESINFIKELLNPIEGKSVLYTVIIYNDDSMVDYKIRYFLIKDSNTKEVVDYDKISNNKFSVYRDSVGVDCLKVYSNKSIITENNSWVESFFRITPFSHKSEKDISIAKANWHWNQDSDSYGRTLNIHVSFEGVNFVSSETENCNYESQANNIIVDNGVMKTYNSAYNLVENNMTLIKDKNLSLIITSDGKVRFEALGVNLESDKVLPLENITLVNSSLTTDLRISSSVKENEGNLLLLLCVNGKIYSKEGKKQRDKIDVEYIELFSEAEYKTGEDYPTAKNCFYGNVYDLSIYKDARGRFNLATLNQGSLRELYSYAPSNYKLAHSIYRDFAFLKRGKVVKDALKNLPDITTIRVFNRSVWDSILVDNYPISYDEITEGKLYYNNKANAIDPYDDTDVYSKKEVNGEIKYYLSDCIEQDLLTNFEVYNGVTPSTSSTSGINADTLSIIYNDSKTVNLTPTSEVQIINTLLEPISYNNYPMTSSDKLVFAFDPNTNSIQQKSIGQPDEVDNFIVIPSKADSSDDSFEYSADLDFNMYLYPEFDASKWLSKGSNVILGYNSDKNIYYSKLSDNEVKSSEKNNILLPLVIPPQESSLKSNGNRDRRIFLDRLLAKNLLLSNSFKTFLNSTSYYTEVRIPYAVNTVVTTYEKSLGKRLYITDNQTPIQGRTYYRMKNKLEVNSLLPVYSPEYVPNGGIFEWVGEGNPPLGKPSLEESNNFIKVSSMKRGVTYYKINDGDSTFIPLDEFTPFDSSYTDESLYFTLVNDEFVPYNKDSFDVNGKYYHEFNGVYPYEKFELLSKVPSDRRIYDSKLELLYNSDNKNRICIKDVDNTYIQYTDEYFNTDTDYYIGTYNGSSWSVDESTVFRFEDNGSYFEIVTIGGKEYHSRLSVFNTGNTIYSMTYTQLSTGASLSASKSYYEYIDDEYVIARDTYFDTESVYYEDKLGDKNFYKLVGDTYEKIKSESPTYENWDVERDGYIYDKISTNSIEYLNKWDAIRTLKEGTYYFTCKYPLQILPFKEDELDLPNRRYLTYYASTRFKVEVTSQLVPYSEESYAIDGYPIKYQSDNLEATLKSASSRENPLDNRSFPHRLINIDLYALDCTEIAGKMNANQGTEDYSFYWTKVASNHPTEDDIRDEVVTLDKETLEADTFLKKQIPLFFSESYTSPFFIAGRDKALSGFTPTSSDDDLITPIEVLDGENSRDKEVLEYTDGASGKSIVLLSGKVYQVLFDYNSYVGEISYTSRTYNNFEDEKKNFSRLVNLLDTNTVSENEYLYNTDGRSFNSTDVSAIEGNTGFRITSSSEWDTSLPGFGNPYSKASNKNLLLRKRRAIEGMGLSGKDSRLNINNSYTFPYSVDSTEYTIPAYIEKVGAVSKNNGNFTEIQISNLDIAKYHYDNLKSSITSSLRSLKGNSDGLFGGISKISPKFVNSTNSADKYRTITPYIGFKGSDYSLYGYSSSRRVVPSGDKNVTITRRSLYSNNLLESNSFDMTDIWKVTGGYGYYTEDTSMDKDVFALRPSFSSGSKIRLDYIYGKGGVKYTSKFEVAINLKGNVNKVYAVFTVNGKQVTGNYEGNTYLGRVELKNKTQMEGNYSRWYTYSAETPKEIDADGVYFEIEVSTYPSMWSGLFPPVYVASAFVRKSNILSHKMGLADALNEVILTSGLSGVTLKEHSSIIVNLDGSNVYYPLQFDNSYVKSISSGGMEVYRPLSGISKISEFISNYKDTQKVTADSRLQSMITPWRRRLYITYTNGEASVSVHKYGLIPNYLGALEIQEIHDNTSDIIDTLGKEVINGEEVKKLRINLTKNETTNNFDIFLSKIPLVLNEEHEFSKFGCNLRLDRQDSIQDFEALSLSEERFSVIFNAFNPVAYREGINKSIAITNVQLLSVSNDLISTVLYELEYLPIVYSELKNHVSFNILFYI